MNTWEAIALATSLEVSLTALATVAAALAVWIPFSRACAIALRARAATRPESEGAMARLYAETLEGSLHENEAGHPQAFLRDAARQYVLHEYEESYARPMSMYANLLPPIGFIGTTLGLIVLFASMHFSDRALEVGALGLALTSTLFALMSFAVLESLKIALHRRLRECLQDALRDDATRTENAAYEGA